MEENDKKPTGVEQLGNQNLAFQPQAKASGYTQGTKIFDRIFEILQPILLVLTVILALLFIIFNLNYFNILPLSTSFPQLFGALPHRYDVDRNKSALSSVFFNDAIQTYELTGKYYDNQNDRIYIEYNSHIVEFVKGSNFTCFSKTIRKISKNQTEENILPAFCSEVLNSKNKGKSIFVDYTLDKTSGIYYITSLTELN